MAAASTRRQNSPASRRVRNDKISSRPVLTCDFAGGGTHRLTPASGMTASPGLKRGIGPSPSPIAYRGDTAAAKNL